MHDYILNAVEPELQASSADARRQDAWLWGWDAEPGIVSVWAEDDGRAYLWRRNPAEPLAPVHCEVRRFRPWLLLASLDDLAHLGDRLVRESLEDGADATPPAGCITYRALRGAEGLRYRVSASDGRQLERAVLVGASRRLGRHVHSLRDLGEELVLRLPPDEQFLVATGTTYFHGLAFEDLHRLQFDLETTGLNSEHDRIFLVAVRDSRGFTCVLDAAEHGLAVADAERDLIARLVALIAERDPDVLENHNIHGFDLPFLVRRAELLGVPLALGRRGAPSGQALRLRPAARGAQTAAFASPGSQPDETSAEGGADAPRSGGPSGGPPGGQREQAARAARGRYTMPGREIIDTLDAVRRYDVAARDLPGHGLKAVARYFGLAAPQRTYIEGAEVFATWRREPESVRRYALDDVTEADGVARLLGGSAFALAQMAPRRYERVAEAGPATGILDPLLLRAYLREGVALPARSVSDGTEHSGASLTLYAAGVAQRVVKADVASLYPSLMRQYHIVARSDQLGALLALVDRLVELRLAAKSRARQAAPGSSERHTQEAFAAATKILVNSAYGYLAAPGLTRFADVEAANEITARGRALLAQLCRELAARGATLLEADTDGVYFSVPDGWDESAERRMVADVGALLPPLIHLEFEGRYAAMLSHETKNYALLTYPNGTAERGEILLRGVAFRSSRAEPFGEAFLRRALLALLRGEVSAVRAIYLETATAILRRDLPTADLSARVRVTKTPAQYLATRDRRRETVYEALLASGRSTWRTGEQVRVYRARKDTPRLVADGPDAPAARDYDTTYYLRLLRETFASRLARAFTPGDFETVFADPAQPSLFATPLGDVRSVLVHLTPA